MSSNNYLFIQRQTNLSVNITEQLLKQEMLRIQPAVTITCSDQFCTESVYVHSSKIFLNCHENYSLMSIMMSISHIYFCYSDARSSSELRSKIGFERDLRW